MPDLPVSNWGSEMAKLLGLAATATSMPTSTPTAAPTKAAPKLANSDLDYLARTAFGEAEGEGDPGLIAVMHAIRNRVGKRSKWGDVKSVVQAPHQFESWSQSSPRKPIMEGLDPESETYKHLLELATQVMSGNSKDPTGGSTLFYAPAKVSPGWASRAKPTVAIGNHSFMRE